MSGVTRSASPSTTTVVRSLARILSALILLFWSFFITAHLVGDEGRSSRPLTQSDTVSSKRDDTVANQKTTRVVNREGLKRLRETLKTIGFHSKTHFKTDTKPDIGAVWIRQFKSSHGMAREIASAKAKLHLLDDAMKMAPEALRERLERFLRQSGFEI